MFQSYFQTLNHVPENDNPRAGLLSIFGILPDRWWTVGLVGKQVASDRHSVHALIESREYTELSTLELDLAARPWD